MNILQFSRTRISTAIDQSLAAVSLKAEITWDKAQTLTFKVAKKLGRFNTALLVTLSLTCGGNAMAASFVDEVMEGVLGGMANTTSAGAYSAANRGVITGGSIYARAKIFDPRIVTFVPPSFKGGCGGIDLFGGSFSFINADQLVQLFRSIAANAVGLLFQMALAEVCSICQTLIQKFQDIVQALNGMLSNSCEMARGIITNTKSVLTGEQTMTSALSNMTSGVGDVFESVTNSFSGVNSGSPQQTQTQNDPQKAADNNTYGNIVWKAIKETGLETRYKFSGDDTAELLMSVSGTVIIEKPTSSTTASASGTGQNSTDATSKTKIMIPRLALKDFIEGAEGGNALSKYRCDTKDTDGCLNPTDAAFTFEGYKRKLYKSLCGTDDVNAPCDGGVVYALATNNGSSSGKISAASENAILALPFSVGSDISTLATMGASLDSANPTSIAGYFVHENADALALASAKHTIDEIYKSVMETLSTQEGAYAEKAIKEVQDKKAQVDRDYMVLEGQYGSMSQIKENAQRLIQTYNQTPTDVFKIINQQGIIPTN